MAQDDTEMEKKYLITSGEAFSDILKAMPPLHGAVAGYILRSFSSKERPYRYFDTYDSSLEEHNALIQIGVLEKEGASVSLRGRDIDCALTLKIPTADPDQREQYEMELTQTELYSINPNDFLRAWNPMKKLNPITNNQQLQEVVRLTVLTSRGDLYQNSERKINVALDKVDVAGPSKIKKVFYELEIECMEFGTRADLENITNFFITNYSPHLKESSLPKWIKALKLIRGEDLLKE